MNNTRPQLPQSWHDEALAWIRENIRPARSEYKYSSYSLKHDLDHDTGIYVTTNEFDDLMKEAGYTAVRTIGREGQEHHVYKIRLLNVKRRFGTATRAGSRGPKQHRERGADNGQN